VRAHIAALNAWAEDQGNTVRSFVLDEDTVSFELPAGAAASGKVSVSLSEPSSYPRTGGQAFADGSDALVQAVDSITEPLRERASLDNALRLLCGALGSPPELAALLPSVPASSGVSGSGAASGSTSAAGSSTPMPDDADDDYVSDSDDDDERAHDDAMQPSGSPVEASLRFPLPDSDATIAGFSLDGNPALAVAKSKAAEVAYKEKEKGRSVATAAAVQGAVYLEAPLSATPTWSVSSSDDTRSTSPPILAACDLCDGPCCGICERGVPRLTKANAAEWEPPDLRAMRGERNRETRTNSEPGLWYWQVMGRQWDESIQEWSCARKKWTRLKAPEQERRRQTQMRYARARASRSGRSSDDEQQLSPASTSPQPQSASSQQLSSASTSPQPQSVSSQQPSPPLLPLPPALHDDAILVPAAQLTAAQLLQAQLPPPPVHPQSMAFEPATPPHPPDELIEQTVTEGAADELSVAGDDELPPVEASSADDVAAIFAAYQRSHNAHRFTPSPGCKRAHELTYRGLSARTRPSQAASGCSGSSYPTSSFRSLSISDVAGKETSPRCQPGIYRSLAYTSRNAVATATPSHHSAAPAAAPARSKLDLLPSGGYRTRPLIVTTAVAADSHAPPTAGQPTSVADATERLPPAEPPAGPPAGPPAEPPAGGRSLTTPIPTAASRAPVSCSSVQRSPATAGASFPAALPGAAPPAAMPPSGSQCLPCTPAGSPTIKETDDTFYGALRNAFRGLILAAAPAQLPSAEPPPCIDLGLSKARGTDDGGVDSPATTICALSR